MRCRENAAPQRAVDRALREGSRDEAETERKQREHAQSGLCCRPARRRFERDEADQRQTDPAPEEAELLKRSERVKPVEPRAVSEKDGSVPEARRVAGRLEITRQVIPGDRMGTTILTPRENVMFDPGRLTALLVAVSFAAGLNLYVTVAVLGLLARFHVLNLPAGLSALDQTWVIALAIALSLIEAFADKIPYFDLAWNAVHTFIRVPAAAILAYQAANTLSPGERALVTVVAAAIAGVAHTAKTSARVAVSATPEPFTNAALSTGEDVAAAGITWIATVHPYIGASIVVVALLVIVLLTRWLMRGARRVFARLRHEPATLSG
jgi:hypothetical protein